ncbi:hypothetical protein [Emticicia agri]|uniref:hypothetical protein n=1 Tax=Emticicia agri TaxID=2492393 RepID=UPI0013E9AD1C|nr:hypothetical protein [Emticicia agri]
MNFLLSGDFKGMRSVLGGIVRNVVCNKVEIASPALCLLWRITYFSDKNTQA